jgi:glycosyltransferase involved in cell wall biosynthesis
LRICHAITRMNVGGAAQNVLLSLQGHIESGHYAALVTGPTEGPEGSLLTHESPDGLHVEVLEHLIREVHPWHDMLALWELWRYFRDGRFDVVHTHASKAGILARVAATWAGVPAIVHTQHGIVGHRQLHRAAQRLFDTAERFASGYCGQLLAVSQSTIDSCVAQGIAPAKRYKVVHSGILMDRFRHAHDVTGIRAGLGIADAAPVIGKIARICELKGFDFLLEVAPAIIETFPEVRFLIVGDGALRPWFERRLCELSIQQNFVFTGVVSPGRIPELLAAMDVVVHLSVREGLPRSAVEAHASGTPVVGFALDGTPEVVQHGTTGYLCGAGDTRAVRSALIDLLSHPDEAQAMGRRGRQRVLEAWDSKHMVAALESEYARLLKTSQ